MNVSTRTPQSTPPDPPAPDYCCQNEHLGNTLVAAVRIERVAAACSTSLQRRGMTSGHCLTVTNIRSKMALKTMST